MPCVRPGLAVDLDVDILDSLPARIGRLGEVLRELSLAYYVTRSGSAEGEFAASAESAVDIPADVGVRALIRPKTALRVSDD